MATGLTALKPRTCLTAAVADWLFFPDYSGSNPYQSCLAAALPGSRAGTVEDALYACGSPGTVFHLHWEDAIYAGTPDPHTAVSAFLADLDTLLACGGRLVWTMHNAAPHEDAWPEIGAALRLALAQRASVVHVHGHAAAQAARDIGVDADKLLIFAHPGFHDAYPDDVSDEQARRYFGLGPEQTVFAFLGAMRPYKGLDMLRAAFAVIHAGQPDAQLILAGRHPSPRPGRFLRPSPGVRLIPRHLEDATVQYVMRAADFVVLPYTQVTTSGAVMLAFTFGRPVIVPALPGLMEVVTPGQDALVFEPGKTETLALRMETACALNRAERQAMGAQARAAADRVTFAALATAIARRLDDLAEPGCARLLRSA